jgi:hypothetical protein
MARFIRTTQADADFVLSEAERAGQQYQAGNPAGAAAILRHAKAETSELGDVVDDIAARVGLDIS